MKELLYKFKEKLFQNNNIIIQNTSIKKFVIHNDWIILFSDNKFCSFLLVFDKTKHSILSQALNRFIGKKLSRCFEIAHTYSDEISQILYVSLINLISSYFNQNSELNKRNVNYSIGKTNITDYIDTNSKVLIIGFGGIAKTMAKTGCYLYITDMRPESEFTQKIKDLKLINKNIEFVPYENQLEYIKKCSHFVITGSILTNSGLKTILDNAGQNTFKMMYGPSASLMPELLFDIGINAILTYRINDIMTFENELNNSDLDIERILKNSQEKITYIK
ncbi:MAG: DUF364 domain-containing protein [Candidatus Muirbacterium halophilum]|nr:DUF364 domain-containing protein [Candidatus Muirbacterium halophilum]MCK9475961.1 DUF364 domain-containing protein [Candidatus Muirbacterium halophilum]